MSGKDQSEIEDIVSEYDYLLDENSDVIRCMRRLGNLMVNRGAQQFNFTNADENRVRSSVMNMADGSGLDVGTVADNTVASMRREVLQPIIIGQELIWLSNVIPDAADDDWDSYETTGTVFRQLALQEANSNDGTLDALMAIDSEFQELMNLITPEMN